MENDRDCHYCDVGRRYRRYFYLDGRGVYAVIGGSGSYFYGIDLWNVPAFGGITHVYRTKTGFCRIWTLVTAGVNLLLGSPYGIQLVLAGALQAAGTEIAYLIGGRYKGNYVNIAATGILASLFVFARNYVVFGYSTIGWNVLVPQLIVRILSAVIIGGLLVKGLTSALRATGLLRNFSCSKNEQTG